MILIKKRNLIIIILTLIVGLLVAMGLFVDMSKGALQGSYENDDRVVAGLISNAIDNSFLRPITVAETMSKDYTTKVILDIKDEAEAQQVEQTAIDHMASLRNGFGYNMVYAVSDQSRAYFTYNGIIKYVSRDIDENDPDAWYKSFLESKKDYVLDVDIDEANNWSLSVFINTAVRDDNNKLLGVCGIGVAMEEVQSILERYERIYDIKIDLIDQNGVIQVDTDTDKIEKDNIAISNLPDYSDGECYYEILPQGSRTITYLDRLGWYVVVQNDSQWSNQVIGIVTPCLVCLAVCIIIVLVALKLGIVRAINVDELEEDATGKD